MDESAGVVGGVCAVGWAGLVGWAGALGGAAAVESSMRFSAWGWIGGRRSRSDIPLAPARRPALLPLPDLAAE